MKTRTAFYLFVLACLVVLAGCRGAASPVTPSLAVPVASATPTVQPSLTATSLPSLASTLTFTPNPTTTPRPPSPTPTSTFTPTPTYAFTRIGTPLPALEVISPENAGRLVQVARWGKGAVRLLQYAPDGKSLAVATSEGVYFYDANTLELLQFNPFPIQGEPLAFTHNLERLFTTGPGLIIRVWDSTTGELVQSLSQPIEGYDSIRSAALPNDELVIFTPQGGRQVHSFTWDLKTDQVTETAYPGAATYKVSADGSTIFAHRLSDLFFVSWHISDLAASPAVIREYPLTVDPYWYLQPSLPTVRKSWWVCTIPWKSASGA